VLTLARHVASIAILPFAVAVLIPIWIARRAGAGFAPARDASGIALELVGVAAITVGVTLFVKSVHRFAADGRGTLAPWDPPRQLVVRGPYRYVRNPMISGVLFVLFGEALILRSVPQASWAVTFLIINLIYIPLLEEPMLEARFGEAYREYCRHVGRIIPRLRPWTPAPPPVPPSRRA
jgi:protein-S-isoprenylcysteine O-methyltransferase Ste14